MFQQIHKTESGSEYPFVVIVATKLAGASSSTIVREFFIISSPNSDQTSSLYGVHVETGSRSLLLIGHPRRSNERHSNKNRWIQN